MLCVVALNAALPAVSVLMVLATLLLMPKSASTGSPWSLSSTFSGLRSATMIPKAWTSARALAMAVPHCRALARS